jgi:hypothetical protein
MKRSLFVVMFFLLSGVAFADGENCPVQCAPGFHACEKWTCCDVDGNVGLESCFNDWDTPECCAVHCGAWSCRFVHDPDGHMVQHCGCN